MRRKTTELVREDNYLAVVDVELDDSDASWSPTLSPEDVRKLDTVRLALRRGDLAEAAKHARVYEMKLIAG
jgi:hypothetical protein